MIVPNAAGNAAVAATEEIVANVRVNAPRWTATATVARAKNAAADAVVTVIADRAIQIATVTVADAKIAARATSTARAKATVVPVIMIVRPLVVEATATTIVRRNATVAKTATTRRVVNRCAIIRHAVETRAEAAAAVKKYKIICTGGLRPAFFFLTRLPRFFREQQRPGRNRILS
jgi:hypothetical protein